jgi:hypothetical protein
MSIEMVGYAILLVTVIVLREVLIFYTEENDDD